MSFFMGCQSKIIYGQNDYNDERAPLFTFSIGFRLNEDGEMLADMQVLQTFSSLIYVCNISFGIPS